MSFYLDVSDFTANYRRAEKAGAFSKMDTVRETLASAYGTSYLLSIYLPLSFPPLYSC